MKRNGKAWISLAVLWLATICHAAAQERFDLICNLKGTESFHPGKVTPFSRHLSIDLDARVWCVWDQNCDRFWRIPRISKDEIQLDDVDNSFMKLETSVNRHTWMWVSRAHIKEFIDSGGETYGPCKQAPFTPFPATAQPAPK